MVEHQICFVRRVNLQRRSILYTHLLHCFWHLSMGFTRSFWQCLSNAINFHSHRNNGIDLCLWIRQNRLSICTLRNTSWLEYNTRIYFFSRFYRQWNTSPSKRPTRSKRFLFDLFYHITHTHLKCMGTEFSYSKKKK